MQHAESLSGPRQYRSRSSGAGDAGISAALVLMYILQVPEMRRSVSCNTWIWCRGESRPRAGCRRLAKKILRALGYERRGLLRSRYAIPLLPYSARYRCEYAQRLFQCFMASIRPLVSKNSRILLQFSSTRKRSLLLTQFNTD